MNRLVWIVAPVVAYIVVGQIVYLNDAARDWCNMDFYPQGMVYYAIIWPLRLLGGDALCD